ncbi:hypothetical protein GCM10010515_42680 [Streptomyces fructofermentans]|uniref:ABC transporter domain-containing protein n=1 Tax=Streptomyces fructofermentans TaxID=152141 RepID=A0A918KNJ9_9ACTN|nr:hypothetical protein GCM10010515_42680 [Streptomyces fructofermentans]
MLKAVPRLDPVFDEADAPAVARPEPALDIRDLVVEYGSRIGEGFRAVDRATFDVAPGEIVALVGESGSGKTTIARAAIGLAPISDGSLSVVGHDWAGIRRADKAAVRQRVGVVFQNPATSLNPRYTVATSVGEPLRVHRGLRGRELDQRIDTLLENVELDAKWRDRYPHELSGGQRQRVAIARAISLDPDLLIADEPTSALDVSVQARVLDTFRELQARLGFACLFVTHDLAVVNTLCDRVVVMHHGKVVEQGTRNQVLHAPAQEYTRRLIASAPIPDPTLQRERRIALKAG